MNDNDYIGRYIVYWYLNYLSVMTSTETQTTFLNDICLYTIWNYIWLQQFLYQ